MPITTAARPGLLCPRCARTPSMRDIAHPQPLISAIPALVTLSKQVIDDSVDLVLHPWHWRARLLGTSPTKIDSTTAPTHKVFASDPASPSQAEKLLLQPKLRHLRHQRSEPTPTMETECKREKKTVHFVEPEHKRKRLVGFSDPKLPIERGRLELYEVVLPASDTPRVIDVGYDSKSNRWCVDETASFPDREDPVAMICTKNVLRTMTCDESTKKDLNSASSTSKPQFQVNRLPDYGVINVDGKLATLKASSHDLFHLSNLEDFLLHTHRNLQQAISASGGQYMKHWLVDLRQLVTIVSNPDTRLNCKSAFWELARRGFAEKVTLLLWDADDPQPDDSADIETLDWTAWIRAYNHSIPETLRRDLARALNFFHAASVPASKLSAALHPNISIMSHKGITSAIATKKRVDEDIEPVEFAPWHPSPLSPTKEPLEIDTWSPSSVNDPIPPDWLSKACPNGDFNSPMSWYPSAKDVEPSLRTERFVQVPSPHPYPHPVAPVMPDSILARLSGRDPRNSGSARLTSSLSRSKELATSKQDPGRKHSSKNRESVGSATSPPLIRSSDRIRSDVSVASSDSAGTHSPSKEGALITHKQPLAEMDYGKATGGLVEPGESGSDNSLRLDLDKKRAAARVERALREPKIGTSAYDRERSQLMDPDFAASCKRAMEIEAREMEAWDYAASRYGRTDDNVSMPTLDMGVGGINYPAFSHQMDEVLHAEQRMNQSVPATEQDLKKKREQWWNEEERLFNEPLVKRKLRKMLAEKWDNSDGKYEALRSQQEVMQTTRIVQDDSRHFNQAINPAQKKMDLFLSDEHRNQPFENASLSDINESAARAEMRTCKIHLEVANETAAHLRHMLNVAHEKEAQNNKALEKMKGDLAQLSISQCAGVQDDQIPAGVSQAADRLKDLVEDGSERSPGVPQPRPVQSVGENSQVLEAPVPIISTPDDGNLIPRLDTSQQPNGSIYGPRLRSVSPSLSRQSSHKSDARLEANPNPVETTSKGLNHIAPCVYPHSVNSNDHVNQADDTAGKNSDQLVNHIEVSCDDQVSSEADSHVSAAFNIHAESNDIPLVGKDLPSGVTTKDSPINGIHPNDIRPNDILVAASEDFFDDDVPSGLPAAGYEKLTNGFAPNDFFVAAPGDSLDDDLPNGISTAGPGELTNNVRHSPYRGTKKDSTPKKRAPVKRYGKSK